MSAISRSKHVAQVRTDVIEVARKPLTRRDNSGDFDIIPLAENVARMMRGRFLSRKAKLQTIQTRDPRVRDELFSMEASIYAALKRRGILRPRVSTHSAMRSDLAKSRIVARLRGGTEVNSSNN